MDRFVVFLEHGAVGSIRCRARLLRYLRPSRWISILPECTAWVGHRRACHRLSVPASRENRLLPDI